MMSDIAPASGSRKKAIQIVEAPNQVQQAPC